MEQLDMDIETMVLNAVDTAIRKVDKEMYLAKFYKKAIIQIPSFMIQMLLKALHVKYGNYYNDTNPYRGYKIMPTYEIAIIIFDEDYPMTQDEKTFYKFVLNVKAETERSIVIREIQLYVGDKN